MGGLWLIGGDCLDTITIKIIRVEKENLPRYAPFGTLIVPSDADELYAGNGDLSPISEIIDVDFVNNNVELNMKPKIKNKFYVVKYDQLKNNSLTIYRWTGENYFLFAWEHAHTIVDYLGLPGSGFEEHFVTNEKFNETIGNLEDLTTENKENVVGAVNEVDDKAQIKWGTF